MPETKDRGKRALPSCALRADEAAAGRFVLSFSSEEPYQRYFGPEILDHSEGACDLSRLNEIGVILFNHDRDQVVGRIERAWIENRRGQAEITFDTDEKSQVIADKVAAGTLKAVSVAYSVERWEEVAQGETTQDGFAGPCSVARAWTPLEVSIVSVPADPTVGVGRELENTAEDAEKTERSIDMPEITTNPVEPVAAPAVDVAEATRQAVAAERERITQISDLCRSFGMDPQEHIASGRSMAEAQTLVLNELRKTASAGTVQVKETGEDNLRRDMADALLMRSGMNPKNASPDAAKMRSMSLRDMAVECLSRDGRDMTGLLRMSSSELYDDLCRSYFNPTAAFPAILDATIKKSIVEMYELVPATFDLWCAEGTLSDFKASPDHNYILGGGQFWEVPEGGELKASKPETKLLPQRQLKTYGTQFTMTREAFVNDDIDFVAKMPGQYAAKAKATINKQVYSLIYNNPALSDGTALFHADHGNLITTGGAPSRTTIQAALMKMLTQTDPFGDAILLTPRNIIVPVGYRFDLYQVLKSDKLPGTDYNDPNPLRPYGLEVIEDANLNTLAGANAVPWFIAADKNSLRGIQVDYLNGQKTPTVRRMEQPGVLGFTWDIYMDWGITVIDHRALVKNPGTTIS